MACAVWGLEAVGAPCAPEALEGQHGVLACPVGLAAQRGHTGVLRWGAEPPAIGYPSSCVLGVWGQGSGVNGCCYF